LLHGKVLHYTATVGTIHLKDTKNKPTGDAMYIAYTLDKTKDAPSRPVLFALNGGPGGSTVYLNLGAIGPKHVAFANAGDSASDPAVMTDNPGTWLDFTDLVFIDPIGTGFRSRWWMRCRRKGCFTRRRRMLNTFRWSSTSGS
jgi:carboxypeptidase C (cathepsin A)